MNKKRESKIRRRDFLKTSAAAVGVSCLRLDLRKALAQAKRVGKPLLTENNLNRLIRANPATSRSGQELGREAIQDLKSLIRNHFSLTPEQEEELQSLTPEDSNRIAQTISNVLKQRGTIVVNIVRNIRASNATGSDAFIKAGFAEPLKSISIDIGCSGDHGSFECHIRVKKK